MFQDQFDVIKVSEKCYQLHSAGKMFKIEFDEDDIKKEMFDYIKKLCKKRIIVKFIINRTTKIFNFFIKKFVKNKTDLNFWKKICSK